MKLKDLLSNYLKSLKKIMVNQKDTFEPKAHETMLENLYNEHLSFLIGRAGWGVTKIHSHFTFEQERFKKRFYPNELKI